VLDEPVAMLDPIARHDFMATVLAAASTDGVSVLLSSHVLTELERVASYLVLLSRGRVRLAGEVGALLATHHRGSLEELALAYLRENPTEVAR
jgi:ABC-2 type transport system ATP-binding protein